MDGRTLNRWVYKGKTYVAVDGTSYEDGGHICQGCAFLNTHTCSKTPACNSGLRKDERNIIWVEEKRDDTQKDVRTDDGRSDPAAGCDIAM